MQCIRRGYSGLEPLKNAAVARRLLLSRSVTSSACRCSSCVYAILVCPESAPSSKAQPLLLTLDKGYLLTAALPDLQCRIDPLGPPVPTQQWLLEGGVVPPGH